MRRQCNSIDCRLVALVLAASMLLSTDAAGEAMVVDNAGLMHVQQRARIAEYHAYLIDDHGIDFRVITHNDVGDINFFAAEQFAALGIGTTRGATGGLLLVIDAAQDLVRLEVSYSLEGAYPDAFVAYVEHRQMVPFFRAARIADGILATTELIIVRAQRAKASAAFEGEAWYAGSGGGGATTAAELGAGVTRVSPDQAAATRDRGAQSRRQPAETLAAYFAAMQARDANPDLTLYTAATRQMLENWVVTPAQMDNILRTYRNCTAEPAIFGKRYAVIRYPVEQRQCAPFFFELINGAWALDLTMMQDAIRFGRDNSWRFLPGTDHPYTFAFSDWQLDRNGFPVAK